MFDAILEHVDSPPATPVAGNHQRVLKWLKHHVREPLDTYFAYEDATVQDIKAACPGGGLHERRDTGAAARCSTYMTVKSRLQGFALRLAARSVRDDSYAVSLFSWTLAHVAHFVPLSQGRAGAVESGLRAPLRCHCWCWICS